VVTEDQRLRAILETILELDKTFTLKGALEIADRVADRLPALGATTSVPARIATIDDAVRYARGLPDVMAHLPMAKINAIKELRAALSKHPDAPYGYDLKRAKDAIDQLITEDFPF
jgi:hypothetical protein